MNEQFNFTIAGRVTPKARPRINGKQTQLDYRLLRRPKR